MGGGGGFPLVVFIMTDKLTNETTIKQIILRTNKTRKVMRNRTQNDGQEQQRTRTVSAACHPCPVKSLVTQNLKL